MERFESSLLAGLDDEQYNILWVEHTDKDRLELNFFIPNVELTSGKRLQPYFDRADRPLTENFKQVINHDYGLTDPNAPKKQQSLIERRDLPKVKKEALEAINNGIESLANAGQINSREDVIKALEGAGFEIARITPKNLSIKTEGQNLRLKGAFYEQDFRSGESLRETIEKRDREYEQNSTERYQTARKRLDSLVSKRQSEFSKRYPNRANQISEEITKDFQSSIARGVIDNVIDSNRDIDNGQDGIQQDDRLEAVSGELSKDKQINKNQPLHGRGEQDPILRKSRRELQGEVLGRKGKSSDIADKSRGLRDDRDRGAIKKSVKRVRTITRKI